MTLRAERSIFLAALDCTTAQQREAYLAEACAHDAQLRTSVEALLAAHDRTENVLDQLPPHVIAARAELDSAIGHPQVVSPSHSKDRSMATMPIGEMIGPYRLMEQIGEGGFGLVFVAEQQAPVRRKVALKLIKPGMDSREVIARFEAERQALALMDHPNIAKVFDAGTTGPFGGSQTHDPAPSRLTGAAPFSTGRPYFVMELVRGIPITEFCNQRQRSTRQRLELFIDVCQAVQHAHQKGVIHRDLKPSNVLVSMHDVQAVVKVIDFGVAKAISEPLTERTLYTRFAQIIGTPLYMSPEQAELSGLDVDTRSDIYALGVMLYELLTGTTPFDRRRMQTVAFDELRRIIREEEPPRPSARLSTLGESLSTVSANQGTDPRALSTMLRGDLDWIVMKALDKDRKRRYETAAELAADVRRYLRQEPVAARPPSPWYRFGKFARRHKAVLTTATLVLSALVAGTGISIWQALRATQARAEADQLRQEAVDFAQRLKQANVLLDSARANADEQRWSLAYHQYSEAARLQPEHYLVWSGRGSLYVRLGLWPQAAQDYARALKLGAPANNPGWWGVPPLLLYADQTTAYQQVRDQLLRSLQHSTDPVLQSFAIRGCTISDSITRQEATELADRAERLLADAPNPRTPNRGESDRTPDPFRRGRKGGEPFLADRPPPAPRPPRFGPPPGVQEYVAGLAHYRARQLDQAIARLEQSLGGDSPWRGSDFAHPVLALAYQQAGRDAEARQALEQARLVIDAWNQRLAESSAQSLPVPWFDYIECLVLFDQAHQRITGSPPAIDSRIEAAQQRALAALREP